MSSYLPQIVLTICDDLRTDYKLYFCAILNRFYSCLLLFNLPVKYAFCCSGMLHWSSSVMTCILRNRDFHGNLLWKSLFLKKPLDHFLFSARTWAWEFFADGKIASSLFFLPFRFLIWIKSRQTRSYLLSGLPSHICYIAGRMETFSLPIVLGLVSVTCELALLSHIGM